MAQHCLTRDEFNNFSCILPDDNQTLEHWRHARSLYPNNSHILRLAKQLPKLSFSNVDDQMEDFVRCNNICTLTPPIMPALCPLAYARRCVWLLRAHHQPQRFRHTIFGGRAL